MNLKRYEKNFKTISETEQELLSDKKIVIIGCGGLGQYIASLLCRIGVGFLTLIDDDCFDETNLNRQLYCHTENIGKSKVLETKKQLNKINPLVTINAIQDKFTLINGYNYTKEHDLAIDALDSAKDRIVLQDICEKTNIVLISAAIGGWYGQLTIVKPGEKTLSKIYPDSAQKGIESELGNPSFTPALLASLQVSEAIKYLLGKNTLDNSQILYIDLLNLDFEKIRL